MWVSLGTPAAADSTTLAQVAEGELSLQATFDTASTTTGERVSMQLSATNRRSTVATGVVIRVVLPDGLEFVGPPLPDQPAGPRRSWDIGAMDPNTAVSLTADLLVISPGLTSTWVAVRDDTGGVVSVSLGLSVAALSGSSPSAPDSNTPDTLAATGVATWIALAAFVLFALGFLGLRWSEQLPAMALLPHRGRRSPRHLRPVFVPVRADPRRVRPGPDQPRSD